MELSNFLKIEMGNTYTQIHTRTAWVSHKPVKKKGRLRRAGPCKRKR
jgi:hypothetical protein